MRIYFDKIRDQDAIPFGAISRWFPQTLREAMRCDVIAERTCSRGAACRDVEDINEARHGWQSWCRRGWQSDDCTS